MKLATFTHDGSTRIGIVIGDEIVDLTRAAPDLPPDMIGLLAAGPDAMDSAGSAADRAPRLALADVHLEAPVPRPGKYLAVGLNHSGHVEEFDRKAPEFPVIFNKQSTCVAGPYDPVHLPRASTKLDYEGELGFIIGRRCRHVPRDRAREVIAGYVVTNDLSVRDWQRRSPTVTLGKSFDTHGPFGPWIVTADEVPDPYDRAIRTTVSGEVLQSDASIRLIFGIDELIEILTTVCTLEPGDVITTGTPPGVGMAQDPPRWLCAGDVVRVEIDGIGHIENTVIDEPADTAIG